MSNNVLMLLFTGGLFLLALLRFIVLLIDKISKIVASHAIWRLLFLGLF
ncbi:MAG: putative holin-like toxin [Clostridium sp.]